MLERSSITALLGPTNTGKTHRAVERMLEHDSGMIGLPLRLLAREVFDRVTARIGEDHVALITGEEKRVPRRPAYWICTVEAMPIDREVDFVAVDEVQLAAHPQRGHVFTQRLLHARGRRETWFLGSDTMRDVFAELLPQAEQVSHPRLSRLMFAGASRLSKLPPRSVVVAFSTEHVHEIAERMKRAFGGVAVVLGALSPRTRNAQVAMFQAGEVDHLVATDAIGMGLNLALDHVAFASLRKFDGRELRELDGAEIGQIAGRAGRFRNDGAFGTVAPLAFPEALASNIEAHRFPSVRRLVWRNDDLDFASAEGLLASLKRSSPSRLLRLVEAPEDTQALAALSQRPAVRARLHDETNLRLLWDVCTVPDFRKLLFEAHIALLEALFLQLTGSTGRLDEQWLADEVARSDDVRGDIDTILGRIAAIRTWTYVSYRNDWLASAARWQARTREIEDRLSDALHAALVQRFVDPGRPRRGSPSVRANPPSIVAPERVLLAPSPAHPFAALAAMRTTTSVAAAPVSARSARHAWVESLVEAPYERFAIDASGRIAFDGETVGELVPGTRIVLPDVKILGPEGLGGGAQARVLRRLVAFARDWVGRLLAPLRDPAFEGLSPPAQQIVYHLDQSLGTVLTTSLDDIPSQLTANDRALLAASGIVVGGLVTFASALLRPDAIRARTTLCAAWFGRSHVPVAPSPAVATLSPAAGVDPERYLLLGYARVGARVVRADRVEQVRDDCFAEGLDHVSVERTAESLGVSSVEARRLVRSIAPDAPRTAGPNDVAVSKRLSYVLRHRPDEIGLTLDPQGWVDVEVLTAALATHGLRLSPERIRRVVAASDKQRFALSHDGTRIRANQGHSIPISLGYEAAEPPMLLFHGTSLERVPDILRDGLVRGRRHDVHLSLERDASWRVGARHGSPAILLVDSGAMHRDGHVFTRSANGVWLTRRVPPQYLRREPGHS